MVHTMARELWPVVYPEKVLEMPNFSNGWLRGFTMRMKTLDMEGQSQPGYMFEGTPEDAGHEEAQAPSGTNTQLPSPAGNDPPGGNELQNAHPSPQSSAPEASDRNGRPLISPAEALEALCTLHLYEEQQPNGNRTLIEALNQHERVTVQRNIQQHRGKRASLR